MRIGPYTLESPFLLAPMAGITDAPFRRLCRSLGAGLTTSEMTTADISLWRTTKSNRRLNIERSHRRIRQSQSSPTGHAPTCTSIAPIATVPKGVVQSP